MTALHNVNGAETVWMIIGKIGEFGVREEIMSNKCKSSRWAISVRKNNISLLLLLLLDKATCGEIKSECHQLARWSISTFNRKNVYKSR